MYLLSLFYSADTITTRMCTCIRVTRWHITTKLLIYRFAQEMDESGQWDSQSNDRSSTPLLYHATFFSGIYVSKVWWNAIYLGVFILLLILFIAALLCAWKDSRISGLKFVWKSKVIKILCFLTVSKSIVAGSFRKARYMLNLLLVIVWM